MSADYTLFQRIPIENFARERKNMAAADSLLAEMRWFGACLGNCLTRLGLSAEAEEEERIPQPSPSDPYGSLILAAGLTPPERLILIFALTPYVKPETLGRLFSQPECQAVFMGRTGGAAARPTVQSALILLSGGEVLGSLAALRLFAPDAPLRSRNLLRLDFAAAGDPVHSAALIVDEDVVSQILWGRPHRPAGADFPAVLLTTPLAWDDLVLPPALFRQLSDIVDWVGLGGLLHSELGLGKHLRGGFRALFHGPPGTGKTLTAALLGQKTGWPVYRIDLSMLVSKFIGETEKNLERLFRLAETRRWILFFDEADALFGRRTGVEDAHDRYANQETAYLLQRLENFPGLVVMSTNLESNIDPAFTRRFNCALFFPRPDRRERERLWLDALGPKMTIAAGDWESVLDCELSGGQIANIALRLGLAALRGGNHALPSDIVRRNIALEMALAGRG